jgi:hypothetical protein
MLIRDLFVFPNRGTIILLDADSPELTGVKIGTILKQGDNIWKVSGVESRSNPLTIGVLLTPVSPIPELGEILVVL